MVDSYYSNLLKQFENELLFNFINAQGKDITDVVRGKIFVLRQVLGLKDILENYNKGAM